MYEKGGVTPDVSCTASRASVHHHNNPSLHYQARYSVMSD